MNKEILHKIILANGTTFESKYDCTLLDAATNSDIALEYSCRSGRCGVCKAQVISGSTSVMKCEASLSIEEQDAGYILTCCRSAISDLMLDVDDLGDLAKYKAKTLPARIDSIKFVANNVMEVVLRLPPSSIFDYRAGQYIDVIGDAGVRRSYSIANAPREDRKIKLEIRKVENGVLSQYWFNEAKVNDLLRIHGPLGTFSFRPKTKRNLVLLATGTGIAPIKSILEELSSCTSKDQLHFDRVQLYWGGRFQDDLYWEPDFPNLPLNFTPVLSRTSDWLGRTGYVQQAVLDDQIDLSDSTVYACGSENMIHSAKITLVSAGLSPTQFYSDAFVSSS